MTRREQDRKALERNVIDVFEHSGRTFAPSAGAWHRSGDLLSDMARKEGLEIGRLSKSFGNDILLALSCRETGCVLVTDNERDFQRIRRHVFFDYISPWPPYCCRDLAPRPRRSRSAASILRSARRYRISSGRSEL
jgi:hypothetical protein